MYPIRKEAPLPEDESAAWCVGAGILGAFGAIVALLLVAALVASC